MFSFVFFLAGSNSETKNRSALALDSGHQYVPGEILIKYKSFKSDSTLEAIQHQKGFRTIRKFENLGVRQVKLPPNMGVERALEIYKDDPMVEYAEPNYLRYLSVTTPNDTYFTNLWGLNNTEHKLDITSEGEEADIDAPEAWDITTGNSGVVIAVMDTGVDYEHPDLSDNIWVNAGEIPDNGIDDDGNGYVDDVRGWDFVDHDNNPIDPQGHGTHVSGIIAAKGDNEDGITGICWVAQIMPLRVSNALGIISVADEISAIDYAINNDAKIINASFGGYNYSLAERIAIDNANSAGILFVASAGNDGTDNDSKPYYPAGYDLDNIITVASTDQKDNLSSFSNYGSHSVDLGAPGERIYSTSPARQIIWEDDFDDGDMDDWTTGGIKDTWGLTSLKYHRRSYSLAESPGGDYQNDSESWAMAPVLALSSYSGAKLEFKFRGITENLPDSLYVQTSTDGSNWIDQDILIGNKVYTGISGYFDDRWFSAYADLGKYYGSASVYIRFSFASDLTETDDGLHIDDVKVTAASSSYSGTEYTYRSGTSMATPHVTGVAGLIRGLNPNLSVTQVKDIILNSVDTRASLIGKTITGGRINALNALPPLAPSGLDAIAVSSNQIELSWIDNSSNEWGFKIERKLSGGTYSQIGKVSSNITTYNDTSARKGTSYVYRLRAYNSNGNSSSSNEADDTTPSAHGEERDNIVGGCAMSSPEENKIEPIVLLLWIFGVCLLLRKRKRIRQPTL